MSWILPRIILVAAHAQDVREPSDRFVPPRWRGKPWGPAAAPRGPRADSPRS